MTTLADLERAVEQHPLGLRLSRLDLPAPSPALRDAVLTGAARSAALGRRRAPLLAVAVAAGLAVFAVSPAGAALARAVLPAGLQQRLGLVEGAPSVLSPGDHAAPPRNAASPMPCSQVPAHPAPQQGGGGGYACFPDLSLAAAQAQVHFPIPTPQALPAGVGFRGALVDPGKPSVFLTFGTPDRTRSVGLWVTLGAPVGGSAVPSGTAQAVTVEGGRGWYVHGSYGDSGLGTPVRWNPAADDEELTWQHDGMTFDLTAAGLHWSAADLVRLAESVR